MKQLPREMTNYEKIKFLLEMWVYKGVEVMYKWSRILITRYVDEDINWPYFYWEWWVLHKSSARQITSITPIPNPPKLLPVGTKVRVFEEYKRNIPKDIVYTTYWMDFQSYTILIAQDEEWEDFRVPARSVYPVWED